MGFKFQEDKIGLLSHGGGIISLQPSLLTIGGQQYRTNLLSVAHGITLGSTLHFLYAVASLSGVVTLTPSLLVPSAFLLANPRSKLVGAYYSNGLAVVGFGSFVRITGQPKTENSIPYILQIVDSNNTNVMSAQAVNGVIRRDAYFEVEGRHLIMSGGYYHTSPVGINGVSAYVFRAPVTFAVLPNSDSGGGNSSIAPGFLSADIGGGSKGICMPVPAPGAVGTSGIYFKGATNGGTVNEIGPGFYQMANNNLGLGWADCRVRTSQTSDTPLVDL